MLQMPNRPTDYLSEPSRPKSRPRWLKIGAALVALVVIGSMLLGIVSNLGSRSSAPEADAYLSDANRSIPQPTVAASYANGAPGVATVAAAAATTSAGGAAAPAALPASDAAVKQGSTSSSGANQTTDRMIIRNATLSVQADDVEKFLTSVRALANEQNGVVMQATTSVRDNKTYANVTLQVPSAAFDATISRVRQLSFKVESESTSSQDVTEEYVDVDAQVRNLKATEASYLELLKQAKNVNDTLTVQRELTNVRGQIERLQGRLNYLSKKSTDSTISLAVSPRPTEATKTTTVGWDAGKVLDDAWQGSLRGLQGLATVLITLGVYGWWVLPLLALAYFAARFGWKRFNRPTTPTTPPSAPTQPQNV